MMANLVDWLLPAGCCNCRAPAKQHGPLCEKCDAQLRCMPAPPAVGLSGARGAGFDAHAAVTHAGPARSLVHAIKYRGGAALAGWIAQALAARVPAAVWDEAVIVPVPAHPANVARRGYDQTALVAERLCRTIGTPVWLALARSSASRSQSRSGPAQRRALPAAAFTLASRVVRGNTKPPQFPTNVVVLDDVCTSGVTLELCASKLSGSFHGEIRAVTITRAQPR
jgi:predicted amidophosphoribosyltransferase